MTRKERKELELKAFDLIMSSMEYNGEGAEVWEETKAASNSDLIAFIRECGEELDW